MDERKPLAMESVRDFVLASHAQLEKVVTPHIAGVTDGNGFAEQDDRALMLLNLGDGVFADFTDGLGLTIPGHNAQGPRLADLDNDGDLDMFTGQPRLFFINQGDGTFVDRTDAIGIDPGGCTVVDLDLDNDGFLDLVYGCGEVDTGGVAFDPDVWQLEPVEIYRNNGNDNHYLRVQLAGDRSQRQGVGARIIARAGDLHQLRDIAAGDNKESIAHFGLGQRTQVDSLEIRWPSGQIDLLENIPADQMIRVIEGRGTYHPIEPTVWITPPPENLAFGETINLDLTARPALFEPAATITRVTGDLSSLGGPADIPLEDRGDGTYRLTAELTVGGDSPLRQVAILIEQETSLGPHWIKLSRNVKIENDPFTAVVKNFDDTEPQDFSLEQNYPNPFNSSTTIRFALPHRGEVELAVYNLTGQKIATLIDGSRSAGAYTVHWDGRDGRGRELASGIYLYRLRAGGQEQILKLALVQ